MKKTLSKMFAVAVVIALVASMIIAVVPAAALSLQPVTINDTNISATTTYTIPFTGTINLTSTSGAYTDYANTDTVTVTFPSGTSLTSESINTTDTYSAGDVIAVTTAGNIDAGFSANLIDASGSVTAWASGDALVAGDTLVITATSGTISNLNGAAGSVNKVQFNNGNGGTSSITAAVVVPAANQIEFWVPEKATVGYKWTATVTNVTNPGSPGSYSLSVATSEETTAVSSAAYTIGVPVVVSDYNSSGNFVGSYSMTSTAGDGPLQQALNAAQNGYTIKLAPGTYAESATNTTVSGKIVVPANLQNVTITTTGSAADTIIANPSGSVAAFVIQSGDQYITVDNITFSGQVTNNGTYTTFDNCNFNYPGGTSAMTLFTDNSAGTSLTVENCTFDTTANGNVTADVALLMDDNGNSYATPLTSSITNCTFKLNENSALQQDVAIEAGSNETNFTASGCTFTGATGGIGYTDAASANATFLDNTFTSLQNAAVVSHASTLDFEGNTVTGCIAASATTSDGAVIISTTATSTTIVNNTFKDGTYYSLNVTAVPTAYIITGNQFLNNTNGFYSTQALNVVLNWWGNTAGPTTSSVTGGDTIVNSTGTLTYEPFLTAAPTAAEAAVNTTAADTAITLPSDSSTTVGVSVSSYTAPAVGDFIVAQNLGTANPSTQETPFPVINYYDIYTSTAQTSGNMQINFYATGITTGSQMYYYSGATSSWQLCSNQGVAGSGAYVYVTVGTVNDTTTSPGLSDLTGTYFAMVSGQAAIPSTMSAVSPTGGSTQGLTGIPFTWSAVKGATGYQIVISANGDLSNPVVSENVSGTAYAYTGTLQPGAYFWQASAYQNNAVINQTPVSSFMAAAPTTAVTQSAPTITITSVPAPTITMTQAPATTLTITQPAVQEVTPAWIWGIIGIGAVLIIVVIVLIVRTRRSV